MKQEIQKVRTFLKYLIFSQWYKNREISAYPYTKKEFIEIINNPSRVCEEFPRKIWMYWEGELIPYIVQRCVQRIKDLNQSFQVIFLDPESLVKYLPNFNIENLEMPLANKADLIRLELLYRYGGIWMDATIILNESLDWTLHIIDEKRYDCIGFWKENSTKNLEYPVIESWFLCCPPNSPFIKDWLDELRPLGQIGAKKYFEQIRRKSNYVDIIQDIDRPEYLLVYLAQQAVMQEKNNFNVCLQSAEKISFYYQEKLNWNFKKINFEFMLKSAQKLPPIIKLINHNFSNIDYCKINGFINKKSVIGQLFDSQINND
ncbi:MAG: hypothetical protein BGN96_07385 [Bacteroidales bacterium 45-6]|nr:MAG: hypothetical protein BGN96_07385 [Bacteroidales bacterium 45-6]